MKNVEFMILLNMLNDILRSLNQNGIHIIDHENPDTYLDRIEYHKADSIVDGQIISGVGDSSDNLYCFFKNL